MRIDEVLSHAAREAPGALALVYGEQRVSFAALDARVDRLAAGLTALAAPGDRVAVLSENRPAVVESYYGVPRAGMGLVLLNPRLAPRELVAALANAGASVLIGERRLLAPLLPHLAEAPALRQRVAIDSAEPGELSYEQVLASTAGELVPRRGGESELAWLIYTSGTTGRPKGAMLSHRNLVAGVLASTLGRPVRADDVYLYPFPLCHVSGHNVCVFHLQRRPVVLLRRFEPRAVIDAIARHRVTAMSLAPTMLVMLLDEPALACSDLGSLRSIGYGASAIPAEVLRRGLDRLGCDFGQGYGMTELAGNAVFLDAEQHRRGLESEPHLLGAAGRPGPLVALRILDAEGRDVATGQEGEIAFRGDQVTRGYWNDPEASARAFLDGWFLTGDIGRRDEEGLVYVVDRKKDLIITGGENVSSREVEDVLHLHPAVREAAVVGEPDPKWGERICAVVALRPGAVTDEPELIALVREHLASYKKPQRVVFLDELPKNSSGKILKHELRARLAALRI